MGLGVPFLLVGLGVRKLMGALAFVKRNYHWIAGASGVVMIAIGVLVATNLWTRMLGPVLRAISNFSPPI
jgi:cytochrome c-type biogenesis protein